MKCVERPKLINQLVSPPARGRGLKYLQQVGRALRPRVAPRTGAWIEIPKEIPKHLSISRRPPHGGVD